MGRTRASDQARRTTSSEESAPDGGSSSSVAEDRVTASADEGQREPSFEASAERLAAIVEKLESGELSLEASLELFEEGVRVARAAQRRLDEAEQRVEELLGVDELGEAMTRELER